MKNGLFVLFAALLTPVFATAGQRLEDAELGFSLVIPDGFSPAPELLKALPNIVHAYRMSPVEGKFNTVLMIQRLRGRLGIRGLNPEEKPKDFKGILFSKVWQDHEIDVIEVFENVGTIKTVTFNAQVPLEKEGIQVILVGPAEENGPLVGRLEKILASLQGRSEWDALEARQREAGDTLLWVGGINAFFVIGGAVLLAFLSKRSPRGTVFCIGAVILLIGTIGRLKINGLFTIFAGGCQTLGLIALVLGVIDLLRSRPSTAPNPKSAGSPDGK